MHLFVSAGSLDQFADPVAEGTTSTYTGLTGLRGYKRITSLDRTARTKELYSYSSNFSKSRKAMSVHKLRGEAGERQVGGTARIPPDFPRVDVSQPRTLTADLIRERHREIGKSVSPLKMKRVRHRMDV